MGSPGPGRGKQKVDQPGAGGSVQWPVLVIVWQLNSQNSDQQQLDISLSCVTPASNIYVLSREQRSIKCEHQYNITKISRHSPHHSAKLELWVVSFNEYFQNIFVRAAISVFEFQPHTLKEIYGFKSIFSPLSAGRTKSSDRLWLSCLAVRRLGTQQCSFDQLDFNKVTNQSKLSLIALNNFYRFGDFDS